MSGGETLIRAQGLGKCFKLYDRPYDRLRDWIAGGPRYTPFWALRGFDLEVGRGECVGIIGPNGAGKSTLLKLLSGTLTQTEGTFEVHGRVLSLLELGTGFNPQLTGRHNVLNTAELLGFAREDVASRLDEIVAFSELGVAFDRPLRSYSSGMRVRLAFAMFVTMEPDVLIVDEALSVGDASFRRRCYQRIEALLERGTTCLFVTHDLSAVTRFCHRGVVLKRGEKVFEGAPRDACNALHKLYFGEAEVDDENDYGDGSAVIEELWFEDADGERLRSARSGQDVAFCYRVRFAVDAEDVVFGFHAKTIKGTEITMASTDRLDRPVGPVARGDAITLRWRLQLDLNPGHYFFGCGVRLPNSERFMARRVDAVKFPVVDQQTVGGIVNLMTGLDLAHERAPSSIPDEAPR